MSEKIFEFHGLSFKVIVGGLIWFSFALVGVIAGIRWFFGTDFFRSSAFIAVLVCIVLIGVFKIYGAYRRKLWRIIVSGENVEVGFGGKLKSRFAFSELEKIHLNGWFNNAPKSSYRWLRLTTARDRFTIIIGDTNLINTADRREIKSFDEFFALLESYAISRRYAKIDLKRSYHEASAKNFYYEKIL